jgi:hypothetical protein
MRSLPLVCGWLAVACAAAAAEPPRLAHWTFDEPDGAIRDAAGRDALTVPIAGGASRVPGIHGTALRLAGRHALQTKPVASATTLPGIAFSAWVRPEHFDRYNEIFRQECAQRLLFSFQEHGRILSLGLNVGGYVECDARIDPGRLLDGAFHHVAAAFDGKAMRVYLDGKEIGRRDRPGAVAVSRGAPAFIGSLNGTSEHFQGALDDLRIYGAGLAPAEVAALYEAGRGAVERMRREMEKVAGNLHVEAPTFAEALSKTAAEAAGRGAALPRAIAKALDSRLKRKFPSDYEIFSRATGRTPAAFLAAGDPDFLQNEARRIVGMFTEYKPLTEEQWKRQTPGQMRQWKEAEAFEKRLKALAGAERSAPDWVRIILDAAPRIQLRPYVQEAVAPYVPPSTPETRDLPAAGARAALERDWLHQAGGRPTPDRIRKEIGWTRELAARIAEAFPGRVDFAKDLAALDAFAKRAAGLAAPDTALYFAVRDVKRRIAFANPAVDFDKVLYIDMPFPQGREWNHETRHRLGYMAVPGARLLVLEGLSPAGRLRRLMPKAPLHGSFWRPDLSWDASKVLFCFKPHNEKSFHLYEIGADGTGLVQLTDGPYDDLDPIYLPDGHLLFSTTRGHTYVRCMPPTNAYVLARCDADGRNIYLVSCNNEPDYLPSVMDDGRVVYTRWEYTDKALWRVQGLWTVRPDGTQVNTFWGNQSVWPDLLKDARQIPGSRRVMFTGSAHHNWFAGSVGIVDPDRGVNYPDGLTKVTADVVWPESGNGPVDPVESPRYHPSGRYAAYYSPHPLGERDFLVSANRNGKFVLYLMDVDGNRELVYEGAHNILHAMPLKPRKRPSVLPDTVVWPARGEKARGGVLYSANVYRGAPAALKDKAKFLRILSINHKTYTYWHKRPYLSTGPVVSGVQSEGVKRVLGTVPVAADGSISFRAPAGIPLHFQLLDGERRALQTMRSFTQVMPGERRGCLGCHELHSRAPASRAMGYAVRGEPHAITPPPWGEDTVSYPRYVRPVLDRYCATCHTGDGKGRKAVDMTARPGKLGFDEMYWLFTGRPAWGKPYKPPANPPPGWGFADMIMVDGYHQRDPAAYRTFPPMTRLSYRSRLVERVSSGKHHDVKVDPESRLRIIHWVDAMCPYRGDEEVRAIPDPEFQGVDWLSVRPRIETAPRIVRPGPVD